MLERPAIRNNADVVILLVAKSPCRTNENGDESCYDGMAFQA